MFILLETFLFLSVKTIRYFLTVQVRIYYKSVDNANENK